MLQIISGKFFNSEGPINKELENEVLYSNFYCYTSIKTEFFEIIPINPNPSSINKYLITYVNKYQPIDEKDILYLATSEPITLQIEYLLTFYLNCYFHKDKAYVENLCINNKNPKENRNIASVHLPHIFNIEENNFTNEKSLIEFINKIILLERKSYNLLIKLLKAYYNALEAFQTNYELSYMTLVYSLETLVSETTNCLPLWEDFEQNKRIKLEKIFEELEDNQVDEIKSILLKDNNLKLKKNFTDTLYNLTLNDFFEPSETLEGEKVLKSELLHVLNNLYFIRSKYVHKLDSLDKVVQTYGFNKTSYIYDEDDPKFSIYGLTIYTKYIINSFINDCKLCKFEDYQWRKELPGIITVKIAPQYWVWKYEGLKAEHLNDKFNGFIDLFSRENTLLDIKDLLTKIEKLFEQLNDKDFTSAFSIYLLFNTSIEKENKLPNSESIIKKYLNKTKSCKIQYMVINLYLKGLPEWDLKIQEEVINDYYKNKFKKQSIKLSTLLETKLLSKLANQYIQANNKEKYIEFIERAILESGNNQVIYDYLVESKKSINEIDLNKLEY